MSFIVRYSDRRVKTPWLTPVGLRDSPPHRLWDGRLAASRPAWTACKRSAIGIPRNRDTDRRFYESEITTFPLDTAFRLLSLPSIGNRRPPSFVPRRLLSRLLSRLLGHFPMRGGNASGLSVKTVLMRRVEECDGVLPADAGLNVVDAIEYVSAARPQRRYVSCHVFANRGRIRRGQDVLRIDPAAPKDEPIAELAFQFHRIHAGGADLDRVQDVDAVVQQVGDVALARSARVIPHLGAGTPL